MVLVALALFPRVSGFEAWLHENECDMRQLAMIAHAYVHNLGRLRTPRSIQRMKPRGACGLGSQQFAPTHLGSCDSFLPWLQIAPDASVCEQVFG